MRWGVPSASWAWVRQLSHGRSLVMPPAYGIRPSARFRPSAAVLASGFSA